MFFWRRINTKTPWTNIHPKCSVYVCATHSNPLFVIPIQRKLVMTLCRLLSWMTWLISTSWMPWAYLPHQHSSQGLAHVKVVGNEVESVGVCECQDADSNALHWSQQSPYAYVLLPYVPDQSGDDVHASSLAHADVLQPLLITQGVHDDPLLPITADLPGPAVSFDTRGNPKAPRTAWYPVGPHLHWPGRRTSLRWRRSQQQYPGGLVLIGSGKRPHVGGQASKSCAGGNVPKSLMRCMQGDSEIEAQLLGPSAPARGADSWWGAGTETDVQTCSESLLWKPPSREGGVIVTGSSWVWGRQCSPLQ